MIKVRKSEDRGGADHGWLQARHTFSFADYQDRDHMNWGVLRVLNEDRIAPEGGFGAHPHRDMEIITYMISGTLTHTDSMGHRQDLGAGEVQHMTAGSGVRHSEANTSAHEPVHLLQIWLYPQQRDLTPGYQQKRFPREEKRNRLKLLASPDGAQESLPIQQQANVYASVLEGGVDLTATLAEGRLGWVQVVSGTLKVNGKSLSSGDGAGMVDESLLEFRSTEETEFLFFDLPKERSL